MTTIVFLDQAREVAPYLKYRGENPSLAPDLCIAGNVVTQRLLQRHGLDCVPITNYDHPTENDAAWETTLELSELWFRDREGKDLTRFQDISFGQALKYFTVRFFYHALKAIDFVLQILEQEKPEVVILGENPAMEMCSVFLMDINMYKVVFKYLAKQLNYETVCISPDGKIDKNGQGEMIRGPEKTKPLSFFSPNTSAKLPDLLLNTVKQLIIFAVDKSKNFLGGFSPHSSDEVRVLVQTATDISYLGKNMVDEFLSSRKRVLYYRDHEMNCYFKTGLRHLETNRIPASKPDSADRMFLSGLSETFQTLKRQWASDSRFQYQNIPVFELCESFFHIIFRKEIPTLWQFMEKTGEALRSCPVDVIILTNKVLPKAVILAQIANQKGIPALHISHGHNYGHQTEGGTFLNYGMDIRYFPSHHSHETVGLKFNYQLLVESGVPEEKLFLAGIPEFETREIEPSLRREARKKLDFKENENILLYATQLVQSWSERCTMPGLVFDSFEIDTLYNDLIRMFGQRTHSRLALKFRPGDMLVKPVQERVTSEHLENISIFLYDLKSLLLASDAVLITQSNVGIEALFYDIPIVQYLKPGKVNTLPLASEGAAIPIQDLQELNEVLDRLHQEPAYRQEKIAAQKSFLKRNLPDDNLTAAKRIVTIIDMLAGERKNHSSA